MSYTRIEDLPDLGDLEGGGRQAMPHGSENIQKHIRDSRPMNAQSGMAPYNPPPQQMMPPQEQRIEHFERQPSYQSYNCVDVARHIQDCPICSKLYYNDKSVYIIAIVVLCIICLLLLKKVLNV